MEGLTEDYDADLSKLQADLKDKQDEVQKKTFTKWINSYLSRLDPPSAVKDLFADLRDGVLLLNLLKELTGETLIIEKGDRFGNGQRIHHINNVRNALQLLQDKKIKMVNIHAGDIVDGRPSIILGLIWTLILHFQIEESTKIMCSKMFGDDDEKMSGWRKKSEPKVVMLKWAQKTITEKYGVEVKDFGASWRNGVAFHALIHDAKPHIVDMEAVVMCPARENLERAFDTAERVLGIPRLLDPEDVDVEKPDEKSIMTYVSKFVQKFPQNLHSCEGSDTKEMIEKFTRKVKELDDWLNKNNEFASFGDVQSMQMEDLLISLNEFSSLLEDEHALCKYLHIEVRTLLDKVPHNFQVMALEKQVEQMKEQFEKLKEMIDSKIKNLQDVEIMLEKLEHDLISFEKWKNYAVEFINKLENVIEDGEDIASLEKVDLEKWKDHVSDNYHGIVLMNDLEALDKVKVLNPRNYERLKRQVLDSLMSFREIRDEAFDKFSTMEFKVEECKCEKLMCVIFTDMYAIEDRMKIGALSHEKALEMLNDVGISVAEVRILIDSLASICEKNLDLSFHQTVDKHQNKFQTLNDKLSTLTYKIKSGNSLYEDYLARKSGIVAWIEKMEMQVHHLRVIYPESDEYEGILDDFKEMMNEIHDHVGSIQESKIILQELAFNSAWAAKIDEETKHFHDFTERLENLNRMFEEVQRASSIAFICKDLKASIKEKIKLVEESCFYGSAGQSCDDTRAIKVMLEEFERFESSVSEVEILMEEGYALLDDTDAYRCLATFLKEAFQFCCDSRNIAHERLDILKKSLELWANYESIRSRFIKYSAYPSPSSSRDDLCQQSKINQLTEVEHSLMELKELDFVIAELSKHISYEKHVELVEDCNKVRDNLKKAVASLSGEIEATDLSAMFEHEMNGLQKFIKCRKIGISAYDSSDDVDMEKIAELMNQTKILIDELATEGSSRIQCIGEFLRRIEENDFISEDMKEKCSSDFKLLEGSFEEFCEEVDNLHRNTSSDAEHLMKCDRIVMETSEWIRSEQVHVGRFEDVEDAEMQLRKAEELHSTLEYHETLMSDLESEGNLVSERNNIDGLVCKLRHELEAFKVNLGACHVTLNDLIDSWREFIDLRNQIDSMKESIADQLVTCKASLNRFEACVVDGRLSSTLKDVTMDVEKIIDSNNHLRSIIDKLEPHITEGCQKAMWNKVNENEWIYQSLGQEVNNQADNLCRITKEFEMFASEIDDCLYQIENLYQEIEDVTNDLKDIVTCEMTSTRVKEIFSSQLENISLLWDHIKEKKEFFSKGVESPLHEKLMRINSCIGDISDLNVHLITMCSSYDNYFKMIKKAEMSLIEFEDNLMDSGKAEHFKELYDLLDQIKLMEETMKEEVIHLNGIDGKSCNDYSLEWLSQSTTLLEKFHVIKSMHKNLSDAELMFKTIESMITKLYESFNSKEIIDFADVVALKSIIGAMEDEGRERLNEIEANMKDLEEFMTSENNLIKLYECRYDKMKDSLDDLSDNFESQRIKSGCLMEMLQTFSELLMKADKYSHFEAVKLISIDDVETKLTSLQECHYELSNFKMSLKTAIQDVNNFAKDKDLIMFSKFLSAYLSDLSNYEEKLNTADTKLLRNIENLNALKLRYKEFIEEVAVLDGEISNMIDNFKDILLGTVSPIGVNFQKYQEDISRLRGKVNSMETKPEWNIIIEHCSQGDDAIATEKNQLLGNLAEAEELIGCLICRVDQCQERTEMVKCQISSLKEQIKILTDSLLCIDDDSDDDDDYDGKLAKVEEYFKLVEEYERQIDSLQWRSADLVQEFKTFASQDVLLDLNSLVEKIDFIKHKLNNLQQTFTMKKELAKILNKFKNFLAQIDELMDSMKTENVRNINKALQRVNNLIIEGEQIEQDMIKSSSELSSSSDERSKIIQTWNDKKQELEMLRQFYEDELIRSDSLKMRLLDFKTWMENMMNLHSKISSETSPQFEVVQQFKDLELNLKNNEICVENLSNLMNSASNFDENKILIEQGEVLILKYSQLREKVNCWIRKSTRSLENVEKFQKDEQKVKDLLNSMKQKISKNDSDERFEDQMTTLIDIDMDLDVVQIMMDKMDEGMDYKEMSEDDKEGIQSCMESIKTDLIQINESKSKLESNLKEQSDLFRECKNKMEDLKEWIDDKECLMSNLKSGDGGTMEEELDEEMTSKMRCMEELKEKMKSLNHDDARIEMSRYSSDLNSLKTNFIELSAMLKDRTDHENEYFKGLDALIKCAGAVVDVFEEGANKDHKDHLKIDDENVADLMSKLKGCLSEVKLVLNVNNGGRQDVEHSKDHQLSRIHNNDEMEKLVEYLDNWISFQNAFEKFHDGFKSNGKDDSNDSCNILGSYRMIQNWHTTTTSEDRHQIINKLTTMAENLKPVAMTTWCQRAKELWDDVYKAAKKLVTCLTRWTSKVEDIERSLKKYDALQSKVSEFMNINDDEAIEANDDDQDKLLIQRQEKVKDFEDIEGDLAGMMEAAFDLMTFVGHQGQKVKLEKEVVNMKEEFERCKIASDMKSIKLSSRGSDDDCFDVVDGNTILEQNELLELANTSIIQQDATSPDEGYKTFLCDASLHDILSIDQSDKSSESLLDQSCESLESPVDQSCEGLESLVDQSREGLESPNYTEEARMVECKRELDEGLNYFINFLENLKPSQQSSDHPNTNGISMILDEECQSIIPKDKISRDHNNDDGDDDDDDNTSSSLINYSSPIDTSSISSCYSNFLLFLSSCFECFSFQPKPFYQQLEEMKQLDVTTKNLEYFNIVLPMKVVFKLKKIADWFDPVLKNLLTNENLMSRLRCYLEEIFNLKSKDKKWNRRNVSFNDAILSQKLSRQRKELDVIAKDQNNYISMIKKLNESFQELSNCINQVQPSNNAIGLKDHMTAMAKSLKKSKLNLEMLRNSSSIYSKREGLCQHLLKLLDAKMEEACCEVEDQRRKIEEKEESARRSEGDLEALTFKINNHRKWFDDTNLMDLSLDNDDIFKCVEHETRNRIRDISKTKTSLDLMTEHEKWIRESRCNNKIDFKFSCNHFDESSIQPSMWQLLTSEETSNDDEVKRLSSDVDRLFEDGFQFRRKLRICKVERSNKNLIDINQLDEFNQLESAWKNHKDDEIKLNNPVDVSSSSSSPDRYKDALERLAVLKLSITSIDITRRKLSALNVQAYLKKFAVIKQELIELLPALKILQTSQSIDRQSDITIIDLDCFWRVLADKIINQIDLIKMFVEHANRTNLKIENYKSDIMFYESHSGDIEGCSVLSHYKHCEEVRSLIDELRGEVMISIDEFQKHPTWWNFQNFQIETFGILSRVEKLSSELDLKKVKAIEKTERWKKFVEDASLNFMRLNSLDGMLRMSCEKCQVEDIIRLLRTRYSRELHETSNNIKELEREGMKISLDDVTSSIVRCKINLLKNLHQACTSKCSSRLKKLQQVSEMIIKFNGSLNDFKRWTTSKEKELTSPFKFKRFSFDDILRIVETLRTSQNDLKQHGRHLSCLVGVCEVLCFDPDSCPSPLERDAVMATKNLLDGKWIDIIDLSIGRKSILEEVWRQWKKYRSDCKVVKDLLASIKIDLDRHHNFGNFESLNIAGMRRASHFYKELISKMDGECWRRNEVKEDFRQMALNLWVDEADEMHATLERLWREWQDTEHSIRLAGRRIGYHLDLFKMFQSSAVSLHQWLVGISTSLEQVERSFEIDAEFNCRKNFKLIKKMKREVRQKLEEFNDVARSLDVIIDDDKKDDDDDDGGGGDDNSSGAFQQGAKEVMNNFSKFQSDILQRIKIMERKMNLDILEKVDICTNRGSNVDEIESPLPISSHLDKNLKKPPKPRDAPQNLSWSRKVTSVAHTQLLLLILVTSACLLPLSKVQPDDLIGPLSRL